jgi:quinol monooxygenase YgiN
VIAPENGNDDDNDFGRIVMRFFIFLLGMAMSAVGLPDASAQPAQNVAPFYTVTYVEVGPAVSGQAVAVLKAYRDAGRKDTGNESFELLQGISRPNQFTVLGVWKDQKAFETHVAAAHTRQMNEKLTPLLAAPNDTRQHNGLAVAPGKSTRGTVYAVTHVDVIPPQRDNGVAAVKQLAEDSRKHGGNVRFDVWQQTNRPNHFTVVEAWDTRRSFDNHIIAPQTKAFRDKLVTMTGALYDERLFRTVQ